MPCCDTCACLGEPFECLASLYPVEWATFRAYCEGDDPVLRAHVRNRSAIGWTPPSPSPAPSRREAKPAVSPDRPPEGPDLVRKAANFARAVVGHVVAGFPLADDATAEARLEICRTCPLFSACDETCRHQTCGCHIPKKVRWLDQQCPQGKW